MAGKGAPTSFSEKKWIYIYALVLNINTGFLCKGSCPPLLSQPKPQRFPLP